MGKGAEVFAVGFLDRLAAAFEFLPGWFRHVSSLSRALPRRKLSFVPVRSKELVLVM